MGSQQSISTLGGRDAMAFSPNYRRDRLERDRAAHARREEKQRKKEEKTAQCKAERTTAEVPSDDERADGSEG